MIIKFAIRNFKSIEEIELELKPLTILTGPNASGKSNILEAIAIVGQTARLPTNIHPSLTGSLAKGEFYQYPYPYIKYIAHKGDIDRIISFEIHIKANSGLISSIHSICNRNGEINKYVTSDFSSIGYAFNYQGSGEIKGASQQIFTNNKKLVEISLEKENSGLKSVFIYPNEVKDKLASDASALLQPSSFHHKQPPSQLPTTLKIEDSFIDALFLITTKIIEFLQIELRKIFPISGIRGSVSHEATAKGRPSWVGKNGENLVLLLSICAGGIEFRKKYDEIIFWAKKFGISGLTAGFLGDDKLHSEFLDSVLNVPLNLNMASYGSKQILTIITQLYWSEPGDTIMIEEPEISLHPEAQVLLQDLFADAISKGRQVICTTHSPLMILALSRIIKNKNLSNNDIAIYHIEKTEQGTKAKKLKIDERGYISGWIESFAKVEDELFKEWTESLGDE